MHILEIRPEKKNRVRIITDDAGAFLLYQKDVASLGMREGEELSGEVWERFCAEVLQKRANHRALYLLQQQDRTEAQLRTKLSDGGYPAELVDGAIEYVRGYHYIDDLRYATNYLRYHQSDKSRLQLRMELKKRGISSDCIEEAFAEAYDADEADSIRRILEKKGYDPETADRKEQHRLYQYLLRRGFPNSEIKRQMHLT